MIMFIDTHDSVDSSPNLRPKALPVPYTSKVHEQMKEQLISKSIQIERMIQLYNEKTKGVKLKDKWLEFENQKTQSKIILQPKRLSTSNLNTVIRQANSKISMPSTA